MARTLSRKWTLVLFVGTALAGGWSMFELPATAQGPVRSTGTNDPDQATSCPLLGCPSQYEICCLGG